LTPFLLSQQDKLSTYPSGIDLLKTIKKLAAYHNDDDDDDSNKNDSGGQLA